MTAEGQVLLCFAGGVAGFFSGLFAFGVLPDLLLQLFSIL